MSRSKGQVPADLEVKISHLMKRFPATQNTPLSQRSDSKLKPPPDAEKIDSHHLLLWIYNLALSNPRLDETIQDVGYHIGPSVYIDPLPDTFSPDLNSTDGAWFAKFQFFNMEEYFKIRVMYCLIDLCCEFAPEAVFDLNILFEKFKKNYDLFYQAFSIEPTFIQTEVGLKILKENVSFVNPKMAEGLGQQIRKRKRASEPSYNDVGSDDPHRLLKRILLT